MVEFDCEGCGVHVYAMAIDAVPSHYCCATCAFISANIIDPQEAMDMHDALGWNTPKLCKLLDAKK